MKDTEFTAEQKEEMIARSEYEAKRRYRAGRAIVATIVVVEFIISILSIIIRGGLWKMSFSFVFCYLLWKGAPTAREYYAVYSVVFSLLHLASLQAGTVPVVSIVFSLTFIVLRITAGIMIWFSPSVEEFLYSQQVK